MHVECVCQLVRQDVDGDFAFYGYRLVDGKLQINEKEEKIMALYLNVPYGEKDEAKSLGAKWDAKVKKWYIDMARDEYVKFSKWILKDTDDAVNGQR